MLRIEPTIAIPVEFCAKNSKSKTEQSNGKSDKKMLGLALTGLAVIGAAALGLKKITPMSYEEALKKSGVEIKDGVARLKSTGEKFSGKVQRFETRNRRETVEFADGKIKEKLYHDLLGFETEGSFYVDGELKLRVATGCKIGKKGFSCRDYTEDKAGAIVEVMPIKTSVFDWAREYLKKS